MSSDDVYLGRCLPPEVQHLPLESGEILPLVLHLALQLGVLSHQVGVFSPHLVDGPPKRLLRPRRVSAAPQLLQVLRQDAIRLAQGIHLDRQQALVDGEGFRLRREFGDLRLQFSDLTTRNRLLGVDLLPPNQTA